MFFLTKILPLRGRIFPMFGCLLLIVSLITGCIASPAAEVAETVFDSKPVDFMTFKDSTVSQC